MCERQMVLELLSEMFADACCVMGRSETGQKLRAALDTGGSQPYSSLLYSILPLIYQLTAVRKYEWGIDRTRQGRDRYVLTGEIDSSSFTTLIPWTTL
jgi:hypothetical protein